MPHVLFQSHIHAGILACCLYWFVQLQQFLFTALARSGNQSRDSHRLLHLPDQTVPLIPASESLLFRNSMALVHAAANRW